MKDVLKPILTWLLGLFNVGVYQMSDEVDSIAQILFRLNLEEHANEVLIIQHSIEHQQHIIVCLNVIKCGLMLLSLLFLYLANSHEIHRFFWWCKKLSKTFISNLTTLFKRKKNGKRS